MISENISLKPFNTFGIHVLAKRFATFSDCEELATILNEKGDDQLLVLGGGSNILFTRDFNGLVIKNEIRGFEIIDDNDAFAIVRAGAGEIWHEFVLYCIKNNLGGIENLSLIPGNVGAGPMQNIGAYGVELKEVFVQLEAYHIASGEIHTFNEEQCEFAYRESIFKRKLKDQYIITNASFKLTRKNHSINTSYGIIETELAQMNVSDPTIEDVSNAVIEIRRRKLPDPSTIGNAGSFFKNPIVTEETLSKIQGTFKNVPHYPTPKGKVKLAAGWLIEQAGWKGKTFGEYGVHKNQALVLVNYSNASGKQLFDLSEEIVKDVCQKFGLTLEREVNIL
jgi:UDP-N-acetylmuramate dehydrogenase